MDKSVQREHTPTQKEQIKKAVISQTRLSPMSSLYVPLDMTNDDTHGSFLKCINHLDLLHEVIGWIADVEFALVLVSS